MGPNESRHNARFDGFTCRLSRPLFLSDFLFTTTAAIVMESFMVRKAGNTSQSAHTVAKLIGVRKRHHRLGFYLFWV